MCRPAFLTQPRSLGTILVMATLSADQIRTKFLDYYKALGHVEIPSSPLVLKDDPSTLFTSSGMQKLVPYLLGEPHPLGKRLVDVQRCLRAEDLDAIGDGTHFSFFEMLGCWSLGDYFKESQIPWTFNFFVDELGIDPRKLYVTVFAGDGAVLTDGKPASRDNESSKKWKEAFGTKGITANDTDDIYLVGQGDFRIFYYPKAKNWWERSQAPVGDPAGPNSEVFYLTGLEHDRKYGEHCHVNCDCGRYVEIGNDVFMQYKKMSNVQYKSAQKNVDCGWGFERVVMAAQGKRSTFETDLFYPIIQKIEALSTKKYGVDDAADWIYKICADHLRGSVFLIADGVIPSNKLQGYVLRKLLRRVIFQSRKIGVAQNFLAEVAEIIIDLYKGHYTHLEKNRQIIVKEISAEEERFNKTLVKGLKEMEQIARENTQKFSSDQVEFLYQTYGVPKELAQEICKERGWKIV